MGVPGLYRYLTEKYPNIVSECVEEIPAVQKTTIASSYDDFEVADGNLPTIKKKTVRIVTQGVDTSKPNPNGKEFDNLYLDMNGIIHPCCHPEDEEAPKTEEEMYEKIFEYVERIYAAIRPRKVLFLAVDGPAPRAKQNQQRARRYKSAKDMEDQKKVERELREELISRGLEPPPEKIDPIVEKPIRILKKKKLSSFKNKELASLLMEDNDMPLNEEFEDNQEEEEDEYYEIHPAGDNWDSNVITPGTPFMYRLGKALRYFVHMKLTTDDGWKKVKIILSDANVPGEGEHKIMDFIRSQREMKGYNPNTSHVIHGLDADLTMLALATHEPYFYNLREKVNFGKNSGGKGYDVEKKNSGAHIYEYKPLEILHISILREYLEIELLQETDRLPFNYEFERGLDDFVFICFFVGNDFLPHLPSLDIREGAIDLLLALYKESLQFMGGYLTENGDVNVARVQYLLKQVSDYEDRIFTTREKREEYFKQQQEQRKREQKERKDQSNNKPPEGVEIVPILKEHRGKFGHIVNPYEDFRKKQDSDNTADHHQSFLGKRKKDEEGNEDLENEAPEDKKLKETNESTVHTSSEIELSSSSPAVAMTSSKMDTKQYHDSLKLRIDEAKNVDTQKFPDTVKLGSQGWKERYYKDKMDILIGMDEYWDVSLKYLEGLVWVFRYYYTGCDSWDWFYPYHFAPFASDMATVDSSKLNMNFKKGQPYKPFSQLLGVLPPRSCHALPPCYRELMLSDDSPIINYYPTDFKIDLNGKTKTWMGVCLLPFINQDELQAAIKTVEPKLSSEERERNTLGNTTLFVHFEHALQHSIMSCYLDDSSNVDFGKASKDIAGTFRQDPLGVAPSDLVKVPWKADLLEDVAETAAVSACFDFPLMDKLKCKFIAKLLPTVTIPPRMLPTILDSGSIPVVIGQNGEKTVTFCSSREMIDNIMNGKPRNNYLSFRRQGGGGGGGRHGDYNNNNNNRQRVDFSRSGGGSFNNRNRGDNNNYQRNDNRNYDNNRDRPNNYQRDDNRNFKRNDNREDNNDFRNDSRNEYRNNSSDNIRNNSDNNGRNYDRYNRDGDSRNNRNYSDNTNNNRNDSRGENNNRNDNRNDSSRNFDNRYSGQQTRRIDDSSSPYERNQSSPYQRNNNYYQKSPYSSSDKSPYSSSSTHNQNNPYASSSNNQSSPYSQNPYSSSGVAAQQQQSSPYSHSNNNAYQQQPYASSSSVNNSPYAQQQQGGSYSSNTVPSNSPYSQQNYRQSPYASQQQQNYGNNNNRNTPYSQGERRI